MRVAFFHGLESPYRSEKNEILEEFFSDVYAPPMDYRVSGLYSRVLREVRDREIDLLVGSSMGGWFAYCISTLVGGKTLLFNPAVVGRHLEPGVEMGRSRADHLVVLGREDDVIDPLQVLAWLNGHARGRLRVEWERMGHRTPPDIFRKWLGER
jgi:hypothetical protein